MGDPPHARDEHRRPEPPRSSAAAILHVHDPARRRWLSVHRTVEQDGLLYGHVSPAGPGIARRPLLGKHESAEFVRRDELLGGHAPDRPSPTGLLFVQPVLEYGVAAAH